MKTRSLELPKFVDTTLIGIAPILFYLQDQLNIALAYQRTALDELRKDGLSDFGRKNYGYMLSWANEWIDRCHMQAQLLCAKHGRRLAIRFHSDKRIFILEVV